MKKLIVYCLFFLPGYIHAQSIGIGTSSPDASAQLDISSTTKGLLIPRMSFSSRNLIGSPVTSLLIYQTDNVPGFYYYNGGSWAPLNSGGGLSIPFVSLYGGSSTAFEIDMIGGMNNTGIKSQTYNPGSKAFFGEARGNNSIGGYFTVAGAPTGAAALQTDVGDVYLATTSGNVGINMPTGSASEKLQVDGNIKVGNAVWTSGNDRMVKFGDGSFVTIGEAGQDDRMTLAAKNFIFTPSSTYTGYVGINTTTPSAPLSFGNFTGEKINLWNTDATHNYGMGVQGGLLQIHSNDAASDIAFGYGSSTVFTERARVFGGGGIQSQGPNAAFWFKDRTLTNYSGWSLYANNGNASLYRYGLGDAFTIDAAGNMGIGIAVPTAKLEVNGTFKLTDGNQGSNKVLTSDIDGLATWSAQPLANVERFKITGGNAIALGAGYYAADLQTLLYNYSTDIVIDLAANTVTFNKAGLYHLEFDTRHASNLANTTLFGFLEINGVNEYVHALPLLKTGSSGSYEGSMQFTTDRYMPAGTVLRIVLNSTSSSFFDNYLAGYLIAE